MESNYESTLDLVRSLSENRLTHDPDIVRMVKSTVLKIKLPHKEYAVHRCAHCYQMWNAAILKCGNCGSIEFLEERL